MTIGCWQKVCNLRYATQGFLADSEAEEADIVAVGLPLPDRSGLAQDVVGDFLHGRLAGKSLAQGADTHCASVRAAVFDQSVCVEEQDVVFDQGKTLDIGAFSRVTENTARTEHAGDLPLVEKHDLRVSAVHIVTPLGSQVDANHGHGHHMVRPCSGVDDGVADLFVQLPKSIRDGHFLLSNHGKCGIDTS